METNREVCDMATRLQRRARWRLLALLVGLGVIAALTTPALANHGPSPINVGVRESDGDAGRDQYDPSSRTVLTGTQVDFFFDNGFHNVVWVSTNPAVLPDSPGTPGGDPVGSTFSVTPTVAGTYIYFCSIHTTEAEALAATDYGSGDTGGMYGRVIVQADSTPPVWDPGTASATAISASQIDLTWPAATDDSGSVSYEVYEATGASQPAKPGTPATTVTGTSLSRTGLTAGTHYWYWITAVDGAGNAATPDQQADATTSSVAASATASGVVQFGVDPTLSIAVTPSVLSLGTLSPAAAGSGTATVTVQSNDAWSLTLKSIGRDGVDDAPGDDTVFTDDVGKTIPIGRATWDAGSGATALTDADAVIVTGQPATASTAINVDFGVQLEFDDPAGVNYETTVLYTVTQP